jgi:signal transduction histidine kinase
MAALILEIARADSPAPIVSDQFEVVRVEGFLEAASYLEENSVELVALHWGAAELSVVVKMSEAPVFVLTSSPSVGDVIDAMKCGAVDVVPVEQFERAAKEHCPKSALEMALSEEGMWLLHADLIERERLATLGELATGLAHSVNNPAAWVVTNHNEMVVSISEIHSLLNSAIEMVNSHAPSEVAAQLQAQANSAFYPQTFVDISDMIQENLDGMRRIRDIVNDLKGFRGATEDEEHKVMDVHHALGTAVQMARSQAASPVEIEVEIAQCPPVMGAAPRLSQAFLNILMNSIQSLSDRQTGRLVVVKCRYEHSQVWVEISDNGAGIPASMLPRVFDPFFTVQEGRGGLGLGLAICRDIVYHHGGEVEIDSTEGVGTSVVIRLPVPPEHRPSEGSPAEESGSDLPVILVVDDEAAITRSLRRVLRGIGRVVVSNSYADAVDRISKEPRFSLVICDLSLGDGTGEQLYDRLSESHPELSATMLFLTGGATSDSSRAFCDAHIDQVVEKPFNSSDLKDLVGGLIG